MYPDINDNVITSVGAHTALGGIVDAAAAFRCGFTRARELPDWPYFDEETLHEHLLTGHPAADLSDGFQGLGRFLKMTIFALNDLHQYSYPDKLNPSKLGLFMVFPANEAEQAVSVDMEEQFGIFLKKLCQLSQVDLNTEITRTYFEGKMGAFSAIQEAQELLNGGRLDYCLIGAIDTLLDKQRLYKLVSDNKIKSIDNPNGLMPGEAACFILLERFSSAKQRGASCQAILYHPVKIISSAKEQELQDVSSDKLTETFEQERNDHEVPTGEALGQVILQALENAQTKPDGLGTVYCDLNGDTFRASDFSNALVRSSSRYPVADWKVEIPALSFGDTGATCGLLAICLAIQAFARGYNVGENALVTLSEDRNRGSIALRRIRNG